MDVNTWNIILTVAAAICFLFGAGLAFAKPVLLHMATGLISLGLLLWVLVPMIEYIRIA